ncbi:hypothetical protein B9Z55_000166 [Caenorhabditis nigoni]|uniref:F-box associated domain-containing protein n=1 Tax=Caenorhabditis nigoni TaxID=1611254 RepID=A0A2G5VGS6_9PELO|nr:hypothetical protein B9Z55_000166 [Caenorhabditis nigoni]
MDSKEQKDKLRQAVLEYMDPSFRFHLTLHVPALRSIEKEARLHINQLVFEDTQFFINNKTKYELKIDRKYAIEEHPFRISKIIGHDENAFGFPANANCIVMNGDVCMEKDNTRSTRSYQRLMETVKGEEPPVCESTLKLTYITGYGEITIYASSRITTIYEGMKVLIGALFGGRKMIWSVNSMGMRTKNLRWFESGEKPFVRNVKFGHYESVNVDGLTLICHPTSFPLKILNVEMDNRILDKEILVNAEYLIVRSEMVGQDMNYLDLLMISNQKIRIKGISLDTVAGLIECWLEHGRPVGTCWLFEIPQVAGEKLSRYIKNLRMNAQVIESDRRSIKLSMGRSSILSVVHGDSTLHDNEIWIVIMELQR